MGITQATFDLIGKARAAVGRLADAAVRVLTAAWVREWDRLAVDFAVVIGELLRVGGDRWPPRREVLREAGPALAGARDALGRLVGLSRREAASSVDAASRLAEEHQQEQARSQLPRGVSVAWGGLGDDALTQILRRVQQRIHALHLPLSGDAERALKEELVRGVAKGVNPNRVAAGLLRRLEGAFNGGLSRAVVIARTEMLDAYRAAAQASQLANSDTLSGWMWNSALSRTTCASCWSKHGTTYPLEEPGPLDHQAGRCDRMPVVKPWSELGINLPEPPPLVPDAEATFRALPRADQLAVMGPTRLAALLRGDIKWGDLSTLRRTTGWRDSYTVTRVADLAVP